MEGELLLRRKSKRSGSYSYSCSYSVARYRGSAIQRAADFSRRRTARRAGDLSSGRKNTNKRLSPPWGPLPVVLDQVTVRVYDEV